MTASEQRRATLFTRIQPAAGLESRKETAVERLDRLERTGAIGGYEVLAWGRAMRVGGPLCETRYCRDLLDHVEALDSWLDDDGSDCDAFERRRVDRPIVDEHYDVITLPAMCLAVYESGELTAVYPRRDGDRLASVADGLESLDRRPMKLDR